MRFSAFVRVLVDGIAAIVGGLIVGGILGFGISQLMEPSYSATARVMVVAEPDKDRFGILGAGYVAEDRVQNYRSLLTSIGLMQRAIDVHQLEISADKLAANLRLGSPTDTPILQITTLGETGPAAASYANAIAEEFVDAAGQLEKQGPIHVKLVDLAEAPTKQTTPDMMLNTVQASLAGGLIAAAVVLNYALRDPKLQYLNGVSSIGSVPVIGRVRIDRRTYRSGRRSVHHRSAHGVGRVADWLISRESARADRGLLVASRDPRLATLLEDSLRRRRARRALGTGHSTDVTAVQVAESVLYVGVVSTRTRWKSAVSFAHELKHDGDEAVLVIADN